MKKISLRLFVAFLFVGMLFMACESTPKANGKGSPLALFKGEWQSFHMYLDDPKLDSDYKSIASKMPHYTSEGIKASAHSMYDAPVLKAKFDGTNKVVFTILDAHNKEVEKTIEYVYKGKVPAVGYDNQYWETFEAKKAVPGLLNAQYFIAFPPHSHGEGLLHWHARFGGRSIDRLVTADPNWWPTFTVASYSKDEMINHCKDSLVFIEQGFPKAPFEPYAEISKKWINNIAIYSDTSPEVNALYDGLFKKFKGKNNGKDFTRADVLADAEKAYGTLDAFTEVEFNVEGGKNELIIYKGSKVIFRSTYKRVGDLKYRPGYLAMKADKKDAGKFKYIVFTGAHGSPAHFHFWHSADGVTDNSEGKPTCIPANASGAEKAKRLAGKVEGTLEKLSGK